MKKAIILKELKEKDSKSLAKEVVVLEKNMAKLRLDTAMRKLKNVNQIQDTRKNIARIWTILNERALEEAIKNEVTK